MQRLRAALLALFIVAFALTATPFARAEIPARPTGMVNDLADLLPADMESGLEQRLRAYRDQTSVEIAVLIVPTLEGRDHAEYAQAVWEAWRIGVAGEDNGVLLLVVPPPEKIVRIHTGRGIEPYITDLEAQRIIDEAIRPLNRQQRRAEAVVAGVDAIIAHLGDTPWAQRTPPQPASGEMTEEELTWFCVIISVIVLLVIFFVWILSRSSRRGYGGYGGGYSGDSGGFFSGGGGGDGGGGFGGFGGGDSGGGGAGGGSD